MKLIDNIKRKINIYQIIITLTPLEWRLIPFVIRRTHDNSFGNDYTDNHTHVHFLFIDIRFLHYSLPNT
jgi:hypothetical protein